MRIPLIAAVAVLMGACGHGSGETAGGAAVPAGKPIAVVNGDFEQPANGNAIPGWQFLRHAGVDAYTRTLDTESPAQGKASAKMTRTQPQIYGTFSQNLSMKGYDGKTVRVTAKMKSEGVGEKGWVLFMSARGLDGNVYSAPMKGNTPWKDVSIEAKMPAGITVLTIGASLLDEGSGWFDDVKVSVID